MNVVLEVVADTELKEGDIIAYKNGQWTKVSKASYLGSVDKKITELNETIVELNEKINELEKTIVDIAKIIKEK